MQEQEQQLQKETDTKVEQIAAPSAEVPPQRKWQASTLPPVGAVNAQATTRSQEPVQLQNGTVPQTQRPMNSYGYVQPQNGAVPPQMQRPVNSYVQPQNGAVPPQMQSPVNGTVHPQNGAVSPQMQRPVNSYVQPQNGAVPPQMQRPVNGTVQSQNGAVPPRAHVWNAQPTTPQNWYGQNPTPSYGGGWQVPPQVPPAHVPLTPTQKDKRAALWLKIVAGLLVAILLYCIGSDVVTYRRGGETVVTNTAASQSVDETEGSGAQVVIQQQEKPELDTNAENVNADGTYTVEGVSAAVRPSIVEIYNYGDASGTMISGTGSGIILSEDGYIITNAHVLTDGNAFSVIMADETEYSAQVVGSDAKTDLAVIKVDATGLPAATMGNSDEVVLGEAVVAIGNPAGLTGSVTNGIVSGLNRLIRSDATGFDMNCIQTNAAISPGNSGGALVNMYGQVIGITSSKYVSSSYEGLGFAITINEVLPIVEDLVQNGHVSDRVRVGVTFVSLDNSYAQDGFAKEIGMTTIPDDLTGIWVTEIAEDCDIANTDLQQNDVIISVQNMEVTDYDTLSTAIEGRKAGDSMEAVCRRYTADGSYTEFTIQCALMADTSGNY